MSYANTRSVALALSMAALAGCTGVQFDSAAEADTVITVEDQDYDYSGARTYAMPQRVFDLSDAVETPIPPNHDFDDLILTTMADNLALAGYTRVDLETGNPDVVVTVGAVAQRNWQYYGYWGCWGYPGYWCYYPPVVVPVAVDVGTVIITMIDPTNTVPPPAGGEGPAVQPIWLGSLNGLLENSIPNTERRITIGIDQAFDQSPYLVVGPEVPSQPTPPEGM